MGNCFGSEETEAAAMKAPTPAHHHGRPQESAATARRAPNAIPSMSSGHHHHHHRHHHHNGRSSSSMSSITTRSSNSSSSNLPLSGPSNADVAAAAPPYPDQEGRILEIPNLRIFTFAELRAATRNFKPDTVLGEGGFGRVYKGWVDEKTMSPARSGTGMVIAVKKLNPESVQGLQEWQSEVNFLGRLSHPNLVRLIGYCVEDRELLLVYEFMAKGSLENHLFRKGSAYQPISWNLRLRIAIGAARGLAFLHSSEKQIIYRDFKASNILLDTHYNAKLSDFGLAKNGPTAGESHVTTRVMGTYGYAAPEYVATGHLYVKSDVYGFGVVLLEMLTGMRALDTGRPAAQHSLVEWAKPYLADRRKLARLVDPRLEGQYPSKAAQHAAQLTLRCLAGDPRSRPSMAEVVQSLEDIERIKAHPKAASASASASRDDASHGHGQHQHGHRHHHSSRARSGSDGSLSGHPSPRVR
uniref:non-specific serine/threonine protein kinase n=1 Tax=Leersia perrieri TaxID=77586 RepID=A0A0D9W892_9ORYZ